MLVLALALALAPVLASISVFVSILGLARNWNQKTNTESIPVLLRRSALRTNRNVAGSILVGSSCTHRCRVASSRSSRSCAARCPILAKTLLA
ncbi:uncharacterized protein F4812DRAFT_408303 [Daldinia caldariorum]|uniref:uncharacterized protein n=1 Tax=Daldinia caldariorum TaxID=326644 RepID=UPI0020086C66|nr:uncharacterized protein F4812DRAFT_408303 [Daldinia caldariorum]KAI1472299.1 hypothetical protein F4812DRAFT_408303 [Daldinia caldariorum]